MRPPPREEGRITINKKHLFCYFIYLFVNKNKGPVKATNILCVSLHQTAAEFGGHLSREIVDGGKSPKRNSADGNAPKSKISTAAESNWILRRRLNKMLKLPSRNNMLGNLIAACEKERPAFDTQEDVRKRKWIFRDQIWVVTIGHCLTRPSTNRQRQCVRHELRFRRSETSHSEAQLGSYELCRQFFLITHFIESVMIPKLHCLCHLVRYPYLNVN